MKKSLTFPALSGWLLACIILLSPLPLGSNRPLFVALLTGISGLALLSWGIALWRGTSNPAISWHKLRWPALLTLPLLGISTLQAIGLGGSVDPRTSLLSLLQMLAYAGLFLLAVQAGSTPLWARRLTSLLAYSSFAYAAYAITAYLDGNTHILWLEKWSYPDSLTGTFVNRNSYAAYAGMGLLASLGLFLHYIGREIDENASGILRRMPPATWLYGGGAAFLLLSLLLSNSRAGVASVALALLALWLGLLISRVLPRRALLLVGLVGLLGAAGLLVIGGSQLIHRMETGLLLEDERSEIWAATLRMIDDAPLTGQGLGTYDQLFIKYRDSDISMNYTRAHSAYLERTAESGIVAAIGFFAALGAIGLRLLHGIRTRRQQRIYPVLGFAVLVQAALHSLVDFSFQMPANAAILTILLGVGYAQSFSSEDRA